MIALPHLLRLPVAKVINFYRSPLKYAVYLDDWILFDDTGLKGRAARMGTGEHRRRAIRTGWSGVWVAGPEFDEKLRECDRAVYTVGFERQNAARDAAMGSAGLQPAERNHRPRPVRARHRISRIRRRPYGYGQYRVGLKKFMDYLNAVLPLWMIYGT